MWDRIKSQSTPFTKPLLQDPTLFPKEEFARSL